jgi:hypothetical protein
MDGERRWNHPRQGRRGLAGFLFGEDFPFSKKEKAG